MLEIEELPISRYLLYYRDGYIHQLNQSEGGREHLEKCWILEQTEPDRDTLRSKFDNKAQP